jgi:tetratricopeptide (TPR) repeat protein
VIKFFWCALAGCLWFTDAANARCQLNVMAVLPVTMSGMRPIVSAKINGADANFLIDSGAYYSGITPLSAKRFDLKTYASRARSRAPGVGGWFDESLVTVKSFTLASYTIPDLEFVVGGSESGDNRAGIIGQNILQLSDAEYDLGGGVVKLMRPRDCDKTALVPWIKEGGTYSVIDIEPVRGIARRQILGATYINGTRMLALFDTGATSTTIRRSAAQRAGIKIGDPDVVEAGFMRGLGGSPVKVWSAPVGVFKIADEEIRDTRMLIIDELGDATPADMVIGADFFLSHHIYVANSQQKLYFSYNGGKVFDLTLPKVGVPDSAMTSTTNIQRPHEVVAEPHDADAYSRRGAALAARREFVPAIADLTRAISLAPTEAKYFFQRAQAYLANSQPDLGKSDLDQTLKLKPADIEALTLRAQLKLFERDKSGAITDLALADKAASNDSDIRLQLAAAYEQADEPLLAIRQFDLWIETHPIDGPRGFALSGRCWARALLNVSLDQALSDCNDAVKATSREASTLVSRGMVFYRRGDNNKAIADYDAALTQMPKNAWGLYGRGIAKLRAGLTADGNADVAAAILLMPTLSEKAKVYGIAP